MDTSSVSLRRASGDDLATVEALLARNDLPAADVREGPGAFYVATDGDEVVGVGGLERYGNAGLLRSVVVPETVRGTGFGAAVCEGLETRAGEAGVTALYLLTTTAAAFFAARGYERIDRAAAPERIRSTTQFAEVCPETAVCLRKRL